METLYAEFKHFALQYLYGVGTFWFAINSKTEQDEADRSWDFTCLHWHDIWTDSHPPVMCCKCSVTPQCAHVNILEFTNYLILTA